MLDVSKLTEFQQRSLQHALDGLEQPPPDVLPGGEQFWRGMEAGLRVAAAAEGLNQDAVDWIANEFLRRLRDVAYCPPDRVRKRDAPVVIAGLYHHLARQVFEVLRDWHTATRKA